MSSRSWFLRGRVKTRLKECLKMVKSARFLSWEKHRLIASQNATLDLKINGFFYKVQHAVWPPYKGRNGGFLSARAPDRHCRRIRRQVKNTDYQDHVIIDDHLTDNAAYQTNNQSPLFIDHHRFFFFHFIVFYFNVLWVL